MPGARASLLPDHVTPADLAGHIGVSERELRRLARELGACRIFGKAMILLPEDVETILEASRPCHRNLQARQVLALPRKRCRAATSRLCESD